MANSMTGKIHTILPTETIISKKDPTRSFQKRTLVLDCTRFDPYTGERGYDNFPTFEFSGDKCSDLDAFQPGQVVTVSFDLQGTKFIGEGGKERYFTSVRGYKIELRPVRTAPEQQQPQWVQPQQPQSQAPAVVAAHTPNQPDIDPLPF